MSERSYAADDPLDNDWEQAASLLETRGHQHLGGCVRDLATEIERLRAELSAEKVTALYAVLAEKTELDGRTDFWVAGLYLSAEEANEAAEACIRDPQRESDFIKINRVPVGVWGSWGRMDEWGGP